jgi:type IV secretion system protein VirB4
VQNQGTKFSFSKHRLKHKNLEIFRDITDDVEESEFVPYASFFDECTIITKNGELCQTIKVTGAMREVVGANHTDLRSLIRESLKHHVPNDSFAIWLHTIRKDVSVAPLGEFESESFAKRLNGAWIEQNAFSHQFVNEVFITIVHEGQSSRIFTHKGTVKNFIRGLIPSKELSWRNEHLDAIHAILNVTVENILEDLQEYGATRLTMYKENGIYYSDQLRFLEKLINFVDRPMPVVEMDLCSYLTTGEFTFAFNAMEVRTASGKRRFGSILTLKEYKEASLPVIDQFMQLPIEFIVTQCINFVNPQKVLFEYQELANYQKLSEDPDISRLSELSYIVESNRNNPNDFGEQQLTIFLLSDTVKLLEENIRKTVGYFAKYGMVAVREDLKFEETYWAQLPGNFIFVSRMKSTNTSHVGGFANLHNLPVGSAKDNHWGASVTTFHTASGTPYYFNFHVGNNGHTSIVGPAYSGKKVLTHFLLAQSMKFNPKIVYLDVSGHSKSLIEKIGGQFVKISAENKEALFNPFSLRDTNGNRLFLGRWLNVLARTMGYAPTEEDKNAIIQGLAQLFALPESERNLTRFVELVRAAAPSWVHATAPWQSGGRYGLFFTATGKDIASTFAVTSFLMNEVVEDELLQSTVISLMLQQMTDKLNGLPAIFVIEEGWRMLSQSHVAGDVHGWMDHLTSKNAMLISLAEDIDDSGETPVTQAMLTKTATQIYMPNDNPSDAYIDVFGLNDIEFSYLELMDTSERHFLVRRPGETVVGEMNMSGLEEYMHIFTGTLEKDQQIEEEEMVDENESDDVTSAWGE